MIVVPIVVKRIRINDTNLEYQVVVIKANPNNNNRDVKKHKEDIVLIHGGMIADANVPLITAWDVDNNNVSSNYKYNILHYHRRGYAGSSHQESHISIIDQANDCEMLMESLHISNAHIVGHSIGGPIALQFALDHPRSVKSLILLEPA